MCTQIDVLYILRTKPFAPQKFILRFLSTFSTVSRETGSNSFHVFFIASKTCYKAEAVDRRCSVKKVFLETSQNSQEAPVPESLVLCNFIKKEILVQVFPCEFYDISKNTFLYSTPLVAASDRAFWGVFALQINCLVSICEGHWSLKG